MKRLKSASGKDFGRLWLDVFRSHHMAAITMTDTALSGTAGGEAKKLQKEIHDGQLKEVGTMNTLRGKLSGRSRPDSSRPRRPRTGADAIPSVTGWRRAVR